MNKAHQRGKAAEERALNFLKKCGLKPLEKNYRTRGGEIDLIMLDDETIVFIEVRARSNDSYMKPLESIDKRKLENIIYASNHYLQKNRAGNDSSCRFDVVVLTGASGQPKIEWIKNAFEA